MDHVIWKSASIPHSSFSSPWYNDWMLLITETKVLEFEKYGSYRGFHICYFPWFYKSVNIYKNEWKNECISFSLLIRLESLDEITFYS